MCVLDLGSAVLELTLSTFQGQVGGIIGFPFFLAGPPYLLEA